MCVQGFCPTPDASQKRWTLASHEQTPRGSTQYGGGLYASEINLMKTLSNQPAVIYLEANSDFQFYSYGKLAVLTPWPTRPACTLKQSDIPWCF